MSAESPPIYYFTNINFNSSFYDPVNTGLTQTQANALYLRKTTPDTASAIETFAGGVLTDTINSITAGSNMAIASNHTAEDLFLAQNITSGDIYIGVNATATTGRSGTIHIGDGNNITGGTIHINNGTTNASNTNINNGTTTTGTVNIMTGNTSTGTINLATGSGSAKVNIGSGTTTGAITIGNTANATSIFGAVKMRGLPTNNIVFRSVGTKSIISNAEITINYDTLSTPANTVGLSYNTVSGVFTNTNDYTITCQVAYTTAFPSNNSGIIRYCKIFSSTYGNVGFQTIAPIAGSTYGTYLSTSSIFTMAPTTGTFYVTCFQDSGTTLTLASSTSIQILVL